MEVFYRVPYELVLENSECCEMQKESVLSEQKVVSAAIIHGKG